MRGLLRTLRDLSLRGKVTLALVGAFVVSVTALVLVLVPVLAKQRQQLLEQDRRLLSTLRRNYERDFIYDQLFGNRESLALHLAALAGEPGLLWARLQAGGIDLGATADVATIRQLFGADAEPYLSQPGVALLVNQDGEADLVGRGGRLLLAGRQVRKTAVPLGDPRQGPEQFSETVLDAQPVLAMTATLSAAGDSYGRLQLLKSLAPLERSESNTRSIFYGGVALSFVLVLLLLNVLLSRMVLAPVRRVHDAMARAATGDLQARLPVLSRDEVGSIAESFNGMVAELETSRRAIEGYSRDLEGMVLARTAELRASQASLLAVKGYLSTVIANVGTGVVSLDEAGRIETVNRRAGEILGLDPDQARERTLEETLGTGTARLLEVVEPVRSGREERREAQVVCELAHGRRTLSIVASVLRGDRRRPIGTVIVVEDLTQILASQRLEAWTEAVERVIHEIKNPLTPVGLAADTLRNAWFHDPARFADLFPSAIDMIQGAVHDLKELIGEFSRFSRLPAMRAARLDLNALVLEALAPYTQAPSEKLQVKLELAPEAPQVEADADQIKRVLFNVINNALEAMAEKGGELRLRTTAEDGGVAIRIEDDGPGVEDVERIFEPHYTTKVKGTGLGLAIARQIVDEHGGAISAESKRGRGTCVRIFLPAAPVPAA